MSNTTTAPNGVNVEAVGAIIEGIQQDSTKAQTTWAAHVQWDGVFASHAQVRNLAPIASDEPATLGGGDTAPNPVEQLLAALGNCLAVGYAANATLAGIELKDLRVDVRGDVDLHVFLGLAQGHAGFSGITAKVVIDSDATEQQLAELHRKVLASSPVGHTLQAEIPVSVSLA